MAPFADHHAMVVYAGHFERYGLMYLSGLLAIVGIVVAYSLYVGSPMLALVIQRAFPQVWEVLHHKYYVDEAYQRWIVEPLRRTGRFCLGVDDYFIDGVVWLVTAVPRLLAFMLRTLQQGRLQGYATSMVVGLAVILVIMLWSWPS